MSSPILQPVAALVLWSFVMWAWLYATRIPAMQKAKVAMDPTMTIDDVNKVIPPQVRWKADNYNHLMEQPTLFYATALALAVLGDASSANLALAWGYVGLRVVHTLVQTTFNHIQTRFALFLLSSLLLYALAIRAALLVF